MGKDQEQSVTRGVTVLSISNVLNKLLALLYVPILTVIIGNKGNGIYNVGFSIYTLMFVITNTGIPIAIAKLVSELRAQEKYKDAQVAFHISKLIVIGIGAVAAIGMALTARGLAHIMESDASYLSILALAPTVFITSLASIYRGYFQGYSNMTPTAVSQIIEQLFNSVFTIVFAYLLVSKGIAYGSMGATIGTTIGALASFIYLYHRYKKLNPTMKHISSRKRTLTSKALFLRLMHYGLPITLGAMGTSLGFVIDAWNTNSRLFAAGFKEAHVQELYGILTTQYQKLLSIPLSLSLALGVAIIPAISMAMTQGDVKVLHRKIHEGFRFILMVTIPSAVGLGVISQPIITILFPSHPQGAELLTLGSSALIFMSIVQLQTSVLQSIGKTYIPPITMLSGMGVKVILNYVLIANPSINIKGAIIGTMVSYLLIVSMNFYLIRKYIGWKIRKEHILKPFFASFVMGVLVLLTYKGTYVVSSWMIPSAYVSNFIPSCIAIGVGSIVYILFMLFFKGIKRRDIERLPMPIRSRILGVLSR